MAVAIMKGGSANRLRVCRQLNPTHPASSALLNANDPVTMYLLTETALGDSKNYEVLSFEEVEELKKEYTFLSRTMEATRRKLALEMKLRDAAQSLSRLYKPKAPRNSDGYESGGSRRSSSLRSSTGSVRRSLFGKNGPATDTTKDKTNEELTLSTRKCEELAQELWKLERRTREIHRRLLEHTAGILQMTHRGLKKNAKNGNSQSLESDYTSITHDSVYEFDDRSLYKTPEHLDEFGIYGKRTNGSASMTFGLDAIQSMETKLEELSGRMRTMILQANPNDNVDPVPQPVSNGGPVNPTATVEAHLAYIDNSLDMLNSRQIGGSHSLELDYDAGQQVHEINSRLHSVLGQSGLSHSPMPPPLRNSPSDDLQEQLSYLSAGIDQIDGRIGSLLEQKSILTTQIQQQRELNSKSDAERDARIADLIEQLAHARKELEVSERDGQDARDNLAFVQEELDALRQDLDSKDHSEALTSEKEARQRAESEITRLEAAMKQLQSELSTSRDEAHEARARAEEEALRLKTSMEQLQTEINSQAESHAETHEARTRAEQEVSRLEAAMEHLQGEMTAQADAHAETHEARTRAEEEVSRLQAAMEQLQSEANAQTEARSAQARAEAEVARLEASMEQLQSELNAQAEVRETHEQAEQEVLRLESLLEQARAESEAHSEEATAVRSQMQSEISRLETVIENLHNEADARAEESAATRDHTQQEISRLGTALEQLHRETEVQVKEATEARTRAEENAARLQAELTELEGEIVRVQTELTMCKAELDGAYGSRAQRAAEAAVSPAIQEEIDYLNTKNLQLTEEIAALRAGPPGNSDLQKRAEMLERELRETIDDYETITRTSIELEKEREKLEIIIDGLRDRCEQLETQMSEERISWMGLASPTSSGRDGTSETTSTMVLKNEFKKMMRDTRAENMRILKVSSPPSLSLSFCCFERLRLIRFGKQAEQEERRRLEALVRSLRKEHANCK